MRNISFSLTTDQIKTHQKTVTRRLGWKNVKPGELLQACVKCQGIKKGEHPEKLCVIRVVSVRREQLKTLRTNLAPYGRIECYAEGFPYLTATQFISMFCEHNHCQPETMITRIEFAYV